MTECLGPKGQRLFSERCRKPAKWRTAMGDRCDACAESLRAAMRSPNTVLNMVSGRARTEAEITLLVRPIQ